MHRITSNDLETQGQNVSLIQVLLTAKAFKVDYILRRVLIRPFRSTIESCQNTFHFLIGIKVKFQYYK